MSSTERFSFRQTSTFLLDGSIARSLIRSNGLKQRDVAKLLRFSDVEFYRILSAKKSIDLPTLEALSVILGIKSKNILIRMEAVHA